MALKGNVRRCDVFRRGHLDRGPCGRLNRRLGYQR